MHCKLKRRQFCLSVHKEQVTGLQLLEFYLVKLVCACKRSEEKSIEYSKTIYFLVLFLKRTLESRNRSNGSKINHKMKTLMATFVV